MDSDALATNKNRGLDISGSRFFLSIKKWHVSQRTTRKLNKINNY